MEFLLVKQNLEKNGFLVTCFETKEAASDYLNKEITGGSVGFGGSVTLQEMGLYESLSSHNEVFWHWRVPEGSTGAEILRAAQTTEVYLSSVNGLAETGEIINIDGAGNRVSATLYGHKKVYFVVGVNKLAPDFSQAMVRARNVAAPKNAQRLKRKTPCAYCGDHCYDCDSPERICRELSVLWKKPMCGDYEVVLIDENLGY